MIEIKNQSELMRLRRLALDAQGLVRSQSFGRGLEGTRRAIEHLSYVQIDTISVVQRAHHHVLYSRVPGFRPAMLDQLLQQGTIFEYWSHAAAFLPMADFRYSLPYKEAIKSGQTHWYKNPDRKLMQELLQRIRQDGPLRSRDLESDKTKNTGWWNWKPSKKALEQLYMEGELMVSQRSGFQKTYDLTERVLPSDVDTRMPSIEEFAEHVLAQQLRCHQVISFKGLHYHQGRNPQLRQTLKNLLAEKVDCGSLQSIRLDNGETYYLASDALDQASARQNAKLHILSPFDNSLIQRQRLKALFHYEYQLECYLPSTRRRYGYFSLPLLFRGRFIGRMDCKAHRKTACLEIKSLHFEADIQQDAVIAALADALKAFCAFQQCNTLRLHSLPSNHLTTELKRVLNAE